MANFTTIRVPGQNSVVADTVDDTLDLVPGPGISITTNAGADTITIGALSTTGYTGSFGLSGFTGSEGAQGLIGYSGSIAHSYRTFRVAGQSSLVADQSDDIVDIVAGTGIEITTNASIDAITISATGGVGGPGYTGSQGVSGNSGYTGSIGYAGSAATSYKTIRVPGQSSLVADQHDDILDIVAGPGILITTNASIDAITITATGGGGGGGMGFTGSAGSDGSTGFTGSAGDTGGLGYTGSVGLGSLGYTGSVGLGSLGYTGSVGSDGSTGFTGSAGDTGGLGYTGSAGSAASANTALIVACSDESTPLTAGTAKTTFRMPYAFTLTGVRASLTTAQASGNIFTVDLNQNGTSILSTKITIDNTDKSSVSAATPPVISTASLTDDAEITVDIDQIGNGTAAGLKVTLIGYLP